MKSRLTPLSVAIALAVLPAPGVSAADDLENGALLSSEPCPANDIESYDNYVQSVRDFLDTERERAARENITPPEISDERLLASIETPEDVAERLAYEGFECSAITYASDGLKIAGYLWKPVDTNGKTFPLVIVNRGGNRDFGPMTPWRHWGWYEFLDAGYVVLASQYRGGPGSEGEDEFGGADVNDVLNLFPLAEYLGFVDMDNVFMFGGSRGGMMSYLAVKNGADVNALATRASVTNLHRATDAAQGGRPVFLKMFSEIMPGFDEDPEAALTARSAAAWADQISAPVIIFHATSDWRVQPADTLEMAISLNDAGKSYELHLYEGDVHRIVLNRMDMMRRTVEFFDRHRKTPE